MTEEMPNTKKNNLNIKLLVIIGIVLIGLIVGGILIFKNKSKNEEPKSLAIEAIIDKNDAKSITYSPGNATSSNLKPGSKVELVYSFDNEAKYKVGWNISDTSVVKIENDTVIGLKPGTVKIQAIYEGKTTLKSNFISLTFE